MALCILLPQVILFGPTYKRKIFVYINMQDMPMCCLTFLKSYSELEVLNSMFLSTGCISLCVLDTRKGRKTFMYLSLFLLMLSNQHNDCGGRFMYLFSSKDLQVRALFLQMCTTVVLFLICCSSWFDASTHKHKSTLLSTAPV